MLNRQQTRAYYAAIIRGKTKTQFRITGNKIKVLHPTKGWRNNTIIRTGYLDAKKGESALMKYFKTQFKRKALGAN